MRRQITLIKNLLNLCLPNTQQTLKDSKKNKLIIYFPNLLIVIYLLEEDLILVL